MNNCFHCVAFESHRCRNRENCPDGLHYEEYTGSTVKQCLCATIEVFQDGYIHCPVLESIGCEECMRDFGDGSKFYYDESQNYERKPEWREVATDMKTCGLPKGYEHKCCLDENGWCTLGEAEYRDIDTALEMHGCGFIRVNDRYLTWKYGVPYKEWNCGNCQYYKGETHGICTNGNVEPRAKGITENGEKKYIKCKEFWSGSSACEEFKKREVEEVVAYTCSTCEYSEDWGESVEWIKCAEGKKRKDVRKTDTCDNYYSCYSSLDDEPEGDLEEQMKEGDRQEQTYIYRGLV